MSVDRLPTPALFILSLLFDLEQEPAQLLVLSREGEKRERAAFALAALPKSKAKFEDCLFLSLSPLHPKESDGKTTFMGAGKGEDFS
jgi:serine/threonine protein kinase HipA of HipAB toxin-antitoxin module